jgi:hypothetical protein
MKKIVLIMFLYLTTTMLHSAQPSRIDSPFEANLISPRTFRFDPTTVLHQAHRIEINTNSDQGLLNSSNPPQYGIILNATTARAHPTQPEVTVIHSCPQAQEPARGVRIVDMSVSNHTHMRDRQECCRRIRNVFIFLCGSTVLGAVIATVQKKLF